MRAEVTAPDGVVFVREAVMRQSPDPRRPLTVLAWQEGERTQPVAANAANASNATR
jgi:hypothetical protein